MLTREKKTMQVTQCILNVVFSGAKNGTTDERGQPLSFTLSFGEIPWFDEEGEIRRCDWLERNP